MVMYGWVFSLQERINQARRQVQPRLLWQYAAVFLIVILTTLILFATKSHIGDTKVSLVYLLLVLCCAMVAHPGVTFFCGLWSFLCYDFFLVPPYFDLRFASPIQVLDPLAFVVAAVVTSAIAERARQHANEKAAYQKADQLRATLLNLVSHNLRTPLATVKTALTTLLTQSDLASENKQLLNYANAEVDHLNRLVANVLQLSRVEAKAVQINERWDALDELINAVLGHWPQETAAGLLNADLSATPPLVQFDFDLIEAVLTNLVDNALRHGKAPVKVSVSTRPGEVWISVEDCGSGIAIPDRRKLFGKFSKIKSKGIGLGLAVCKGLVEAHGGRIWAEFLPQGTRFTFALPYSATEIAED
jgi:K+-sensing histidine kinase KdpD